MIGLDWLSDGEERRGRLVTRRERGMIEDEKKTESALGFSRQVARL